jgi:hypothetical protein
MQNIKSTPLTFRFTNQEPVPSTFTHINFCQVAHVELDGSLLLSLLGPSVLNFRPGTVSFTLEMDLVGSDCDAVGADCDSHDFNVPLKELLPATRFPLFAHFAGNAGPASCDFLLRLKSVLLDA